MTAHSAVWNEGLETLRVFVVESSAVGLTIFRRHLAHAEDIRLCAMPQGQSDPIEAIRAVTPHVVCLNLHAPAMESLTFMAALRSECECPVLAVRFVETAPEDANLLPLFEAGVTDVFSSPLNWRAQEDDPLSRAFAEHLRQLGRLPAQRQQSLTTTMDVDLTHMPTEALAVNLVAIGVGAGGMPELQRLVAQLPVDFPAPIVCCCHLDAQFQDALVDWLTQHTQLAVHRTGLVEAPLPGSIYLPPPDHHLVLDNQGRLVAIDAPPLHGRRPAMDITMESAAQRHGAAAIGVLLCGQGVDGARGMQAIASAGGVTIIPNGATSPCFEAPRRAWEANAVSHILELSQIAQALCVLTGHAEKSAQNAHDTASTAPTPSRDQAILVVEDSATQAFKMKRFLQDQGYPVQVARDGQEGWEMLCKQPPDLVISDVSMPRMSGFELCRKIKGDAAHREIPVILVTALSSPEEVIEGLASGADAYVTKPWEERALLEQIDSVVHAPPSSCELALTIGGKPYRINASRARILNQLFVVYDKATAHHSTLIDEQLTLKTENVQLSERIAQLETELSSLRAQLETRPDPSRGET
ncbi:chemotaxis protein CheB [Magnetofaba australis]|uniref:protein-glutamate methylesterase n=1 Tax=Magnetofaba australis IT-1 TaxID=1434232 RepID=A0A1Y2K632_9PROT|nr:chemotaxis protein CheB [Magnetofaba australis]OSM05144.1 putative Chemotaxis response regulator protein-glutamate methylesterase 2 [Magnetofaba australis IT-1]